MLFHFLRAHSMKRVSCVCGEAVPYGDEDGPEALPLPCADFPPWPLCAPRPLLPRPLAPLLEDAAEPPRPPAADALPPETLPRCSSRMLDAPRLPAARLTRYSP